MGEGMSFRPGERQPFDTDKFVDERDQRDDDQKELGATADSEEGGR